MSTHSSEPSSHGEAGHGLVHSVTPAPRGDTFTRACWPPTSVGCSWFSKRKNTVESDGRNTWHHLLACNAHTYIYTCVHTHTDTQFNLSSFSFRDIFLLSASESFRVTSLETASSLFCATLKENTERKRFPHALEMKISVEKHSVLPFYIGNWMILYISRKSTGQKVPNLLHCTSLREVQETLKIRFLSYRIWFLLEKEHFPKLGYLMSQMLLAQFIVITFYFLKFTGCFLLMWFNSK